LQPRHFSRFESSRKSILGAGFIFLFGVTLVINGTSAANAQTKEAAKQQAESQLKQMTPQQIDAKIKEYGMTREQAESKAKELGIDLGTYLQQAAAPSPEQPTTEQSEPSQPEQSKAEPSKDKEEVKPGKSLPAVGGGGLPYFGYDVFLQVPAAFEPSAAGPVDPEYIIGPGDVLKVSVWGQVELQNELTVDKEGRIFIPTIGQVLVSGQSLDATYSKLKMQMSRSYSGLVSRPPTVWMDLTISKLRPKRLFMMGEVVKPGGYTVSSYATVFNSLYSIGGPTVRGSLRDVRVIRADKVIAHVDLYKYFTGAEETDDIRVQNNDIIFIPTRGKTVSIDRQVRRPAIYELLPKENLRQLLDYAGGALNTAYLERIQVDRIIPFKERKPGGPERRVIDVNFREILNQNKDYELVDGDRVTVYPIFDERQNIVKLNGAVMRPGTFQLEKTPTIRALLNAAEGPDPRAYLEVAHLIRYNDDWLTRRTIPFELRKVLSEPEADWKLMPRDEVIVFSIEAIEVKNKSVTIRGEVKSPGRFPLNNNLTLDDLILLAGGYTESAELLQAEVARVKPGGIPDDSLVVILHPRLPTVFNADGRNIGADTVSAQSLMAQGFFLLQNHDEVLIRPNPDFSLQQNVSVSGDIKYPGAYAIERKGERLSSILTRAGGPTTTSYLRGAELQRGGQRVLVDFEKAFTQKDPVHDVSVLAGDAIKVPPKPNTVFVSGEVNGSGLLSYIKGDDVSDYIDRAGGLTDSSDYAVLTYPTGERRRVNFGFLCSDPEVIDGSSISVLKVPPPPPVEKGPSVGATITDMFALAMSAATIWFIVWQTTQ
jgi:polysaccharide export outer membrane protein